MEIDYIDLKNKLFNNLYLPTFLENGYKKRGWEFYKILEKDKYGLVVKLTSSSSNLPDSAAFRISIGIKFNPKPNEKLKLSDINLYSCEVQFNIIHLLYPEEKEFLGEYWYDLGDVYYTGVGKKIGDKMEHIHNVYGARTGYDKHISERISKTHIKSTVQEYDENENLLSERILVYRDTADRYVTTDLNDINRQLSKDLQLVIEFTNVINNIKEFKKKSTEKIISDKIKSEIVKNYG